MYFRFQTSDPADVFSRRREKGRKGGGMYSERFWKKNWDAGLDDLASEEFETTYVEMIRETFEAFPDKTAFGFLGMEMTFRELDSYADRFAGMLMENGFEKGDVVGINLPNIPEYAISIIGALRAGCVVSGVSPLLSADQIKYQLNDLASQNPQCVLKMAALWDAWSRRVRSSARASS